MLEDWGLSKHLFQLGKGLSSVKIKKLDSSALYIGFIKLDLADFPLFLFLLPITLLSSILVADRILAG